MFMIISQSANEPFFILPSRLPYHRNIGRGIRERQRWRQKVVISVRQIMRSALMDTVNIIIFFYFTHEKKRQWKEEDEVVGFPKHERGAVAHVQHVMRILINRENLLPASVFGLFFYNWLFSDCDGVLTRVDWMLTKIFRVRVLTVYLLIYFYHLLNDNFADWADAL